MSLKQIFLYLFLGVGGAQAAGSLDCRSYESAFLGHSVNYCIERSRPELAPSSLEPVVYFMHGIRGDAQSWVANGYHDNLDKLRGLDYPSITFVTFDTSATSFFSDQGGKTTGSGAYESWFVKEFVPFMEKTYQLCAQRACRALAGESMGGLGALKTALRYSALFSTAAANSAALIPFNVHESDRRWMDYFDRWHQDPSFGLAMLSFVRNVFPTRELSDWNDPAWITEGFGDIRQLPSFYFDVGGRDELGFAEGFERLRTVLDRRQIEYTAFKIPNAPHDIFKERSYDLLLFLGRHFSSRSVE